MAEKECRWRFMDLGNGRAVLIHPERKPQVLEDDGEMRELAVLVNPGDPPKRAKFFTYAETLPPRAVVVDPDATVTVEVDDG